MVRRWHAVLVSAALAINVSPVLFPQLPAPAQHVGQVQLEAAAGADAPVADKGLGLPDGAFPPGDGVSSLNRLNPDHPAPDSQPAAVPVPSPPVAQAEISASDPSLVPSPAPAVAPSPAAPNYVVVAGDTLSSVARRFGTTADAIARASGLQDISQIHTGQRLTVPGQSSPMPVPAPDPVVAPVPTPGPLSILRTYRMVTYYGMAGKPSMGILGQLGSEDLVRGVRQRAAAFQAAGGKPVLPTLHLVVAQALRETDRDGTYRRRESHATIQRYVDLAEANGLQIILDHQVGSSHSQMANEIAWLRPYLQRPHVHLALDAEYAVPVGVAPGGGRLGSLDANIINGTIQSLAQIVQAGNLPNKVLLVHQFRPSMIGRREMIVNSPWVDFSINMDGHGGQAEKAKWYNILLANQNLAFPSLQIFTQLDKAPFTPAQALSLGPAPDIIVYF